MPQDDPFVYPTGQVVGVLPDADRLEGLLGALADGDVADDRISVVRGGPGEGDLRPDTDAGGPVKKVVRTAQKILGDEAERLHVLDDALEAGHHVVGVHVDDTDDDDARDAEKNRVAGLLRQHGARDIAYYGQFQIEQLDASAT